MCGFGICPSLMATLSNCLCGNFSESFLKETSDFGFLEDNQALKKWMTKKWKTKPIGLTWDL